MISKTYTLYIEYPYIYIDISSAPYQHIYTHTQRMDGTTYDIQGSLLRAWSKGQLVILILSFLLPQKIPQGQCLCTDFIIMYWWYINVQYFHCDIFCLLIFLWISFKWKLSPNSLAISNMLKKNKRARSQLWVSCTACVAATLFSGRRFPMGCAQCGSVPVGVRVSTGVDLNASMDCVWSLQPSNCTCDVETMSIWYSFLFNWLLKLPQNPPNAIPIWPITGWFQMWFS